MHHSTQASSSAAARRSSSISVLSERQPFCRHEKRCSDASIISNTSNRTDFKREVVFPPIHEHNEDMLVSQYEMTCHLKNFASANELERSKYKVKGDGGKFKPEYEATENFIKLECLENKQQASVSQEVEQSLVCQGAERGANTTSRIKMTRI